MPGNSVDANVAHVGWSVHTEMSRQLLAVKIIHGPQRMKQNGCPEKYNRCHVYRMNKSREDLQEAGPAPENNRDQ